MVNPTGPAGTGPWPTSRGGGPAPDGLVALIVYAVGADQAAKLAEDDPAVRGGLMALDIRPWYTGV